MSLDIRKRVEQEKNNQVNHNKRTYFVGSSLNVEDNSKVVDLTQTIAMIANGVEIHLYASIVD